VSRSQVKVEQQEISKSNMKRRKSTRRLKSKNRKMNLRRNKTHERTNLKTSRQIQQTMLAQVLWTRSYQLLTRFRAHSWATHRSIRWTLTKNIDPMAMSRNNSTWMTLTKSMWTWIKSLAQRVKATQYLIRNCKARRRLMLRRHRMIKLTKPPILIKSSK